jgi:hypothetical protein
MIRANVGLSRKLSKDYNSTGYSVNLDGEITAPTSDPEAVVEQVRELFDLAEEVLNQQIDRSQSDAAIANHDEQPQQRPPASQNGNGSVRPNRNPPRQTSSPQNNGNGSAQGNGYSQANGNRNADDKPQEPATNKQIQYLLSIGKRQRLTTVQLESKLAEIIGRPVGIYDLSKMAAGIAIEVLTKGALANGTPAR